MALSENSPFATWAPSNYRSSRGTTLRTCGNEYSHCTEMELGGAREI